MRGAEGRAVPHTPTHSRMRRRCPILLGLSSPSSGTRLLAKPPRSGVAAAVSRACPRGWSSEPTSPPSRDVPRAAQGVRWVGSAGASHHQPHFGTLQSTGGPALFHSLTQICWDVLVLSAGAPGLGGAAPRLCVTVIPAVTPIPPLSPSRSSQRGEEPPQTPAPPSGQCPARSRAPQDPAEPQQARLGGCHPAARPRRVPRAGRQALPQAALTGRFVLCGRACPAGRQKGQSDAGEHCAGSHALRQQPEPPRSPRDPRRPGLCPPWCPGACSVRPMAAPLEEGAVGFTAGVTAGLSLPKAMAGVPGVGLWWWQCCGQRWGAVWLWGRVCQGHASSHLRPSSPVMGGECPRQHGDREHTLGAEEK